MNSIKNYAQLKASAREHMTGGYANLILISIFYMFVAAFVIAIAPGTSSAETIADVIIAIVLSIILNAFVQMMQAGLLHSYMKQCCGIRPNTLDVFSAFKGELGKTAFQISLIIILLQNVCMLPFDIYIYTSKLNTIEEIAIMSGLAVIGMLVFYLINLGFSQCLLLIFDFPDKSAKEIIRLSFWMMKGHKMRFVGLIFSFIPLLFVCVLTFGVGLIWVIPYLYATRCCFYLNLISSKTGD